MELLLDDAKDNRSSRETAIEISVKGRWTTVPALSVDGVNIIVGGKWIKKGIVAAEEWLEAEVEHPELCVTKLKEQKSGPLHADIFTFAQKRPGTAPKYAYPVEMDSIAAIHTASFKDWWEKLPQEGRKNVRRSEKRGVVVTVRDLDDDLVRGIVGVNNDSPVRQGRPYVHYGKSFEQVKKDQSSHLERSIFICAYLGDELIGFMKIVCRGEVASILQMLPKASHQDKRPANALLSKAVEVCEARGISYLTYGLFNYGNNRDNSLKEFKVRNGFKEMLTPRFYVPLTIRGRACMNLKLHRGLVGVLPPSVIRVAVNARSKWYGRG